MVWCNPLDVYSEFRNLYTADSVFGELLRPVEPIVLLQACIFFRKVSCFVVIIRVPISPIRAQILEDVHSSGLTGHFGVAKTMQLLREHFYWPTMQREAKNITH